MLGVDEWSGEGGTLNFGLVCAPYKVLNPKDMKKGLRAKPENEKPKFKGKTLTKNFISPHFTLKHRIPALK